MTMGLNAASLYAPTPTPPACAGGGHRVSRQAEVEDEAMSVWLRHRCLRSPQRSLDARRPSWWGGSTLCERQRAWSVSAPLPRPQARGPAPPPLPAHPLPLLSLSSPSPLPHLLFPSLTLSFSISLPLSSPHSIFIYHTLSFSITNSLSHNHLSLSFTSPLIDPFTIFLTSSPLLTNSLSSSI